MGQYGHPSLNSLIRALPEYFAIKGRGTRKMIWYLRDGSGHGKLNTMPNIFNAQNFNKGMGFYESGISGVVVSSTANYLASLSNPRYTGHSVNSATLKSKSSMYLGNSFCSPSNMPKQFSFKTPDQYRNYNRQRFNTGPSNSIVHNSVGPVRYSTARYEGFKMFPPSQTTPKKPTRVFYHGNSNAAQIPKFTFSTPQGNGIGSSGAANDSKNIASQHSWANQYYSRTSKPMINDSLVRPSNGCNLSPMQTNYNNIHHTPVHGTSYGNNGNTSSEWNSQHHYQHSGNFSSHSPHMTPIRDTTSAKQKFTYPPPNYSGIRNHPISQVTTLSPGIWTNQQEMDLSNGIASMLPIPHSPSPLLHPTPGGVPHQSGSNISNHSFVFPPTNQQEMDLAQFGIYPSGTNTQTRNTMQPGHGHFFA